MKQLIIFTLLILLASTSVSAQNADARKETRKGNKEYKAKKYDQAEVNYRRAVHSDSTAYRAHYNLGNALYRQKKYDEANTHYSKALETPDLDKKTRAKILHNRGNSNLKAGLDKGKAEGLQQFQQAVNDYQEALKLTPKDENTRYNLSYAKKMLQQAQQQQQQNGGGGGGSDQDNNKDKNKDNKNDQGNQGQDKNQDQNNHGQQQDKQQQKQDQQQKQQQQRQQEQKKQDAERLLEAVKNNEKNTMKDNAKKVEAVSTGRIEKDW